MNYLVKQDLWEKDYSIMEGRLQSHKQNVSYEKPCKQQTLEEATDLLMMGTPQEHESDECIAELLYPKQCRRSARCNYIMTNNGKVHGYPLTHRLLYFQVAKRV